MNIIIRIQNIYHNDGFNVMSHFVLLNIIYMYNINYLQVIITAVACISSSKLYYEIYNLTQ